MLVIMQKITLEQLIEIAQEIETEDPIDWGLLRIDEDNAYNLIGSNIIEQYEKELSQMPEHDRTLMMLATMTKLLVENFILNYKLQQQKNKLK